MKLVSYRRVSTKKQEDSNLGLLAQQDAINDYAVKHNAQIIKDFLEVETGTRSKDRPIIKEAIQFAKKNNATLVISKLDRLTRSVTFLSQLMDSNVEFVALDFPKADRTILQLMMVIAEFEADRIKERVNNALAQLKKQGVKLGSPRKLTAADSEPHRKLWVAKEKQMAFDFAEKIYPTIKFYKDKGYSNHQVAVELNKKNYPTYTGRGQWHTTTVQRCVARVQKITIC